MWKTVPLEPNYLMQARGVTTASFYDIYITMDQVAMVYKAMTTAAPKRDEMTRTRTPRTSVDLSPESAAVLRKWSAEFDCQVRDAPLVMDQQMPQIEAMHREMARELELEQQAHDQTQAQLHQLRNLLAVHKAKGFWDHIKDAWKAL